MQVQDNGLTFYYISICKYHVFIYILCMYK